MGIDVDVTGLVRQAQLGDRESMDHLVAAARRRLFPYLYRLTLNHDLAEDLLQETLLKMVESIEDLRQPERFWPWLFRTALGKAQHHYRDRARAQEVEFSARSRQQLDEYLSADHTDGLNYAARKELAETVVGAMTHLKVTYRHVLALRCYEEMSYAEIADQMGCKELRARVLFFRAKRALRRHLSRRGFAKGLLVTGLGLFGVLTSPAEKASAAGTVTAASLRIGFGGTLVGAAGTPAGAVLVITIAGATLTLTLGHVVYFAFFSFYALLCFVVALYYE